jgi:mannose-1-phosphate guanylyltransferase
VVLAAGDGTRLSRLTTLGDVAVPKQFCVLSGGPSLLALALRRAERVVPTANIVTIVAAGHRRWWARELEPWPARNIVSQPRNRGTAAGVLLPLLILHHRDPEARVVLLPSDHYVEQEEPLAVRLGACLDAAEHERAVVLLGVEPETADTGYGWILPGDEVSPGLRRVEAFVEKPSPDLAQTLLRGGGLWNTFLLASRAETLLELYERRLPGLLHGMRAALGLAGGHSEGLAEYYRRLSPADFSRDLLQGAEAGLRLASAPPCGWNDLGTPERVAACIGRMPHARSAAAVLPGRADRVDLAHALAGS